MKRVMRLAEQLVGSSGLLTGIRFGKVTVEEGRSASEMMLCGSGVLVEPVLQWDEERVGDGKTTKPHVYRAENECRGWVGDGRHRWGGDPEAAGPSG